MKKIRIGIAGTKFIATMHANAYKKIPEGKIELVGVASASKKNAQVFSKQFGIPNVHASFDEMAKDPSIDMIDICTPNYLHRDMVVAAAKAGKHVICEKPLTGGFGEGKKREKAGELSKANLLNEALENTQRCKKAVKEAGVVFCYAENYIYSLPFCKALRLLEKSNGTVMDIRADESHSGSHAEYAKHWSLAGGGSLTRLGSHPIAASLYMKYAEGKRRTGKPIRPVSVTCEVGHNTKVQSFLKEKEKWLKHGWVDVEDWSCLIVNFADGTKATVFASDCSLGGCKNLIQVYASNSVIYMNIAPNNAVQIYAPREGIWGDEFIAEKLETNGGWSYASTDDEATRGYVDELREFAECAMTGKEPLSGMMLAEDTVNVIYSGYLSAEKGQRVKL